MFVKLSANWLNHFGRVKVTIRLVIIAGVIISAALANSTLASEPIDLGFRDAPYGVPNQDCPSRPTGEKPESKLWFNDGIWWATLCNDAKKENHIYRYNLTDHSWIDTGVVLDDRGSTRADTLWDGQHLYVASHKFSPNGQPDANESKWGRLYRYSYDATGQTYALDAGFPINITRGKSETLTVAKDSVGRLWVTYVENQQVMVNHSLGEESTWGEPFPLPVNGATNLTYDDISAVVGYDGQTGIMWSNQNDGSMYFAWHVDGAPASEWQSLAVYAPLPDGADDHINIKALSNDPAGKLFAAIKTSNSKGQEPLVMLLVCHQGSCTSATDWTAHTVSRVSDEQTRPIVLIDEENRDIYVFARTPSEANRDVRHINFKKSSLDNIQFDDGPGQPIIQSALDVKINDVTSTKQALDNNSGMLVLASDKYTRYYAYNYIDLSNDALPPTPVPTIPPPTATPGSPTPTSTPSPDAQVLYLSSSSSGNAGGISFKDEDILVYDLTAETWDMFIDGSDIGISSTDTSAFAVLPDHSILMSFSSSSLELPDVGIVDDSDILRFIPSQTGSNTAGSFEWYLDGSDVELTMNSEDIDAIALAPDGRLIISTKGTTHTSTISAKD